MLPRVTEAPFNGPYADLEALLRKRLEVIADHALRDRDPAAHLDALREVSLAIAAAAEAVPALPPRLGHFLERCSYEKALEFIERD